MTRVGACRVDPLRRRCRHRCHLRRNLSRPRLCLCRRNAPRAFPSDAIIINSFSKYFCMTGWRIGWMVVPPSLVRAVERLQQNLAISVPTLSQIAAEAAFDGRAELENVRRGYEENRRILLEGLPRAGFDSFLPADGAFYLYADVSRFSTDSFAFRNTHAGGGGRGDDAGGRFRSACAARISCGCVTPARATICAKRSSGSAIG